MEMAWKQAEEMYGSGDPRTENYKKKFLSLKQKLEFSSNINTVGEDFKQFR